MKSKFSAIILFVIISFSCNNKTRQVESNPETLISLEESSTQSSKITGQILNTITFEVKGDIKDFEDGIQPWASVEKPELDLPNLIDKDEIVIKENNITIIIDYPLTKEYTFDLKSENGFTRAKLLTEISKHYYKLYDEEEKTATVKTLPMEKRTMENRNQTNGKYGIWGHDIRDLVLTEVEVYKAENGQIILSLGIDS